MNIRDVITEFLKSNKKSIQNQIDNLKSQYLKGKLSKVEFSKQRERIDIRLDMLRDLAHQAGIDWETL